MRLHHDAHGPEGAARAGACRLSDAGKDEPLRVPMRPASVGWIAQFSATSRYNFVRSRLVRGTLTRL
jgi:hypothetical protein